MTNDKKKKPFSISSHKSLLAPCIGACTIDNESGYCYGCSRTEEEVYKWEDTTTTQNWKDELIKELKKRDAEF